jgi:excisionase family DNA binding protein
MKSPIKYEKPETDHLLDTYVAAQYLGVHPGTLMTWRSRKKGPAYIKVGARVRYRFEDLQAWLIQHLVEAG